jgi:adenylate cyclase
MKFTPRDLIWPSGLLVLAVYLGVQAPPPLPESPSDAPPAGQIPVETVFAVLAKENDVARSIYTRRVVGAGLEVGLGFEETWRENDVIAGPLPALFLRASAEQLARADLGLALFLGSSQPIASSNRFEGEQARRFARLQQTGEPEMFRDPDSGRATAMFPDVATVQPCVTCHNEHPDSPKTDWAVGDIMGATTWTLVKESYSAEEVLVLVGALRQAFAETYAEYLAEYDGPGEAGLRPVIGSAWPGDEVAIPDLETFMGACTDEASPETLRQLVEVSRAGR